MKVEKKGFTGGIYTLLLDSLSCKMLFWTRVLLGGLVHFLSFPVLFSIFSMTDTAVFLGNFEHLFSFYIY